MGKISTKWQEGIDVVQEIWNSPEENPFQQIFKGMKGICPENKMLPEPKLPEADKELEEDDDPEGYCDACVDTLTPVQRMLRAQIKKKRRQKGPKEKPSLRITVSELLPDGTLGLGLDDAPEDLPGVLIVQVHRKAEKHGWEVCDRIIELNGQRIDDWDDFQVVWNAAKLCSQSAVFGIAREGVEMPPEPEIPQCLHCGSKGKHLMKCKTWISMPEGQDCVYFCTRECQREAWKKAKISGVVACK